MSSKPEDKGEQAVSSHDSSPPLSVEIPPLRTTNSPPSAAAAAANSTESSKHKDEDAGSDTVEQDPRRSIDGRSSWSAGSEPQIGSPTVGNDRVFPIRSVISVDPSQTPQILPGRQDYFQAQSTPGAHPSDPSTGRHPDNEPHRDWNTGQRRSVDEHNAEVSGRSRRVSNPRSDVNDRYGTRGGRLQIFNNAPSERSSVESGNTSLRPGAGSEGNSLGSYTPADREDAQLLTVRFKHKVTAEGHAVITGRDGEALQRCEDEPIHIPGAVQAFGLLVALEELDDNQLIVRVVSENSHRIIGYKPRDLFRLPSFTDILSEEQVDNLLDHIDFIRDEEADPATNGPEIFTISIKFPNSRRSRKLWCAMHINPAIPELIICEFELDDDQLYPLVPVHDQETPELPEDTLNSQPTEEEYSESTHISSKPLRILRSARKRKGEAAAMEVFNIMSQVQEQLASATNLESFLKILVGVVKELTGFHRVMIYQFDATFNGRVVTELVDPRATKDLYKGLNFPASDIPKQARDLYKINKVRLLYDRDLETARLVCRTVQDLERPLDLTFSYLRAMSPIHIKYLANMAVRSSMSISINAFSELWGLIACHTYGAKGMRVSFPIRKMCRLVGDTASRNIERLSYASRLQARKLINTVPTATNPTGYIVASSDDLLKLFDADFGLLSIKGETKVMGKLEQTSEALAMLEYLRMRRITSVVTSQDVRADFPDLRYSPGFEVIAGLLLVPLSVNGGDFIVLFRKGQVREVKWAGNPYEKTIKEGTAAFLEPRKSFRMWSEKVTGQCREWTEEQVETAAVLCLVYGKFIEVWRQKEVAQQNSQLTKLLLANSAHEVRTPLNAIINYLEIALEGTLDQETRENITKSHSASKSLIYVINDLLDLTKTEEGQDLIKDEIFDLPATIREATEAFSGDVKRKGLEYSVTEHPGVPQLVFGDQRRLRQAISNIIANAIQYTNTGWIRIETWLQDFAVGKATVEIVIQDSGAGMSNEKLDELFRQLEQVNEHEDRLGLDDVVSPNDEHKDKKTLGLGLAMVARIVRNAGGQLRLKSEESKGSRFVVQLPFIVPEEDGGSTSSKDRPGLDKQASASRLSDKSSLAPLPADGEITLINQKSSAETEAIAKKRSMEEVNSMRSYRSGSSTKSAKSDVDRLIDAISGPLTTDDDNVPMHQRSKSKESVQTRRSLGDFPDGASPEKPGRLERSFSYGADGVLSPIEVPPGSEFITDTRTLMKAIKVPEEEHIEPRPSTTARRVLFSASGRGKSDTIASPPIINAGCLQTLVAEDDPINSRIIKKRLEKSGHTVHHTVNGEQCANAYEEQPALFDVVLMDMQMPIVDGLTSTKMIRSFEKANPAIQLSARAAPNGRVPIFAVSASLVERQRQTYVDAGFDGWILKPIDFKRLNTLLSGIVDENTRNSCLYEVGQWERGGWFQGRNSSGRRDSAGSTETPRGGGPPDNSSLESTSHRSGESSSTTTTMGSSIKQGDDVRIEPSQPLIYDERLDDPTNRKRSISISSPTAGTVEESNP